MTGLQIAFIIVGCIVSGLIGFRLGWEEARNRFERTSVIILDHARLRADINAQHETEDLERQWQKGEQQ